MVINGQWIRRRRQRPEAYLTQGELANKLGVSQTTLSLWERGGAPIRRAKLLAETFEMPIKKLVAEAMQDDGQ